MPLDRPVIDLSWTMSHGVLYTAERLASFGYDFPTACFCNDPLESAEHLFFHCPLAKSGIDWIQSQLFLAAPLALSLSVRHPLFGFNLDELVVVPGPLDIVGLTFWLVLNLGLASICPCFFFKRFQSGRRRRYFQRQ